MSIDTTQTSARGSAPSGTENTTQATLINKVMSGSWLVTLLAVVVALVVGAVLIALSNQKVIAAAQYFFARPMDTIHAIADAVISAYSAMLRGAIFDWQAATPDRMWFPLTETLTNSIPLILAGLGVGLAFRSGLFNIGGQGQVIMGAAVGAYLAFTIQAPVFVSLPLAVIGAALAGAIWAGIAGVLKAKTGANEVIVTIMLNSIAALLLGYLLTLPSFIGEGNTNPKSIQIPDSSAYPKVFATDSRLHWGLLVAIIAAILVWFLLERSSVGFELRATGLNPEAARTAGISVRQVTILAMVLSGALCGIAGSTTVLGPDRFLTTAVAGSVGFDAITVALLGKSRPLGICLAGVLFGALNAGGTLMQTATQTPIDIVLVIQSTIVLFIAAPPLVRSIFHLPDRKRTPLNNPDVLISGEPQEAK